MIEQGFSIIEQGFSVVNRNNFKNKEAVLTFRTASLFYNATKSICFFYSGLPIVLNKAIVAFKSVFSKTILDN